MSKFGLGRGLADLNQEMGAIPDISILTGGERVVVKQIPLVKIGTNADQPRKVFDDEKLQELADSIKEKGVLQPILLRSVKGKSFMYEIVAGERRYRAAKLAGLTEIPALVKEISDSNAMEIALIENVQRENLNPIEEAAGYQNLINECNYSVEDVAHLIGKSTSFIRNSLRLMGLPDSVKTMVENGDISASHARTIITAENPEQMAQEILTGKMSVATVQKKINSAGKNIKNTGKFIDETTASEIENKIQKALKTPAKLVQRKGGAGQIVLSFATRIQMEELVRKLTE